MPDRDLKFFRAGFVKEGLGVLIWQMMDAFPDGSYAHQFAAEESQYFNKSVMMLIYKDMDYPTKVRTSMYSGHAQLWSSL